MKNAIVIATVASALVLTLSHCGQELTANPASAAASPGSAGKANGTAEDRAELIERGRHLVESVAMCTDCHSPRLPNGQFDKTRYLMGMELPFKATIPMPWAPIAPPIAGLPTLPTDEVAVEFLMTGKRPSGAPVLPPMPEVRLKREEAEAVVAYLRSVKPSL